MTRRIATLAAALATAVIASTTLMASSADAKPSFGGGGMKSSFSGGGMKSSFGGVGMKSSFSGFKGPIVAKPFPGGPKFVKPLPPGVKFPPIVKLPIKPLPTKPGHGHGHKHWVWGGVTILAADYAGCGYEYYKWKSTGSSYWYARLEECRG